MMAVSQKARYALRAMLELTKRRARQNGPTSASEIASKQAIPPRFLELILNQLAGAGLIQSRRGAQGGYILAIAPEQLTVREVLELVEGDLAPVDCELCGGGKDCPLVNHCVFADLWNEAGQKIREVYNRATFADLLRREQELRRGNALDYAI
jgi:Rrf2 family transcriptional regulator, cysteine metabolism repressor